jgi:hypothetical protein
MQNNMQKRNVFHPQEIEILQSALKSATVRLEEHYGSFGHQTETVKLISATAMFNLAQTGNLVTEDLVETAAESVRVFLTWACESQYRD